MNHVEVLVTGCFNVLHPGHVRLLEFAATYGKVCVGINADPYLEEKYNGKYIPLLDRAYCLQANRYVDRVVVFKEDTPTQLILKLKPKYYIKGPDYKNQWLPEKEAIDKVGATLVIHSLNKEYSSTRLVEEMLLPETIINSQGSH